MKNLSVKFAISFLIITIFFVSCKKDEDKSIMSANINSQKWNALIKVTTYSSSTETFLISGFPNLSQSAEKSIIITIKGNKIKNYSLSAYTDELSAECLIVYKTSNNSQAGSDSYFISYNADVSISKIDFEKKLISGSFKGTMYPNGDPNLQSIPISDGVFNNLKFIEID